MVGCKEFADDIKNVRSFLSLTGQNVGRKWNPIASRRPVSGRNVVKKQIKMANTYTQIHIHGIRNRAIVSRGEIRKRTTQYNRAAAGGDSGFEPDYCLQQIRPLCTANITFIFDKTK